MQKYFESMKSEILKVSVSMLVAVLALLPFNVEQRSVLIPLFAMLLVGLGFVFWLYRREGEIPLFDVGLFLVGTTLMYSCLPLFFFAMTGFKWTALSDYRLRTYDVSPRDLGAFAWNHFWYLTSLVIGYMAFHNGKKLKVGPLQESSSSKAELFLVLCFTALIFLFFSIVNNLPIEGRSHLILQLSNMFASVKFVFVLWLMAYCFKNWKKTPYKYILILCFAYQFFSMIIYKGGRSWFFLELLAAVMFYHRLVSKVTLKRSVTLFTSLLLFFFFYGAYKTGLINSVENYSKWSAANEFTILLGTAYDLHVRHNILHQLGNIPLQLYFNDFILLIPSQLLPFEKMDLSQWYLQIIGLHGRGVGMMFGVISQSVIGGGIAELILRGLLLGGFFALIRRWVDKNNNSLWAIVFCVFVSVKSYYTFRAGTGYIFYYILYHFVVAFLIIKIASYVLRNYKSYFDTAKVE